MDGGQETADAFAALEAAGLLNLRVRFHQWVDPSDDPEAIGEIVRRRDLSGSMWTANSVKLMLDGVIDTGTAWLEEPDTRGDGNDPMWPDTERFRQTIKLFHDAGFHIATHAIGDRAVREVLDAYQAPEAAPAGTGSSTSRPPAGAPRQVPPRGRERVDAADPSALAHPRSLDPWSERLGVHRCAHAMPSGDMNASGANVVLGSDWPVAPYDPRLGFFTAQSRYAPDVDDHRPIGTAGDSPGSRRSPASRPTPPGRRR